MNGLREILKGLFGTAEQLNFFRMCRSVPLTHLLQWIRLFRAINSFTSSEIIQSGGMIRWFGFIQKYLKKMAGCLQKKTCRKKLYL